MSAIKKNDGGQAFPGERFETVDSLGKSITRPVRGMSLRDWFAGRVISGSWVEGCTAEWAACFAYRVADAMLANDELEAARQGKESGK